MSASGPQGPQQPPPLYRTAFPLVLVAIAGLLIGLFARQFHWHEGTATPQGGIEAAKQAFQSGNEQRAFALFKNLADQNKPDAIYWVAHMTELGLGTDRDPKKAIELYKKAAGQDVVPAELRLGQIYLNGDLVPPDYAQAKTYLEKAAYHGNPRAAMLLGQMYRIGLGVAPDLVKAYAWSEVSTLEGNSFATRERDASIRNMSPGDQQAAVEQAKKILDQIKQNTKPPKPPQSNGSSAGQSSAPSPAQSSASSPPQPNPPKK